MVIAFRSPFPEFYEDGSEVEVQQQSKQDKASDRCKKSNEAAAGKDGRRTQELPLSQKNGGGNQPERITDVKNGNAEKPSNQPGPRRKSNVEKQKTGKHDLPSPPVNQSDESATGGQKLEKKSYSSPDLRNFVEVKDTLVLRIRLCCKCEGCVEKVRQAVRKFKGVQKVAVKADKDMVKVMGSVERKKLVSYLEEKLRQNLAYLPIKDYDNVVDDHTEDEADMGPMTDCSPGLSTTVQPTCQYSGEDDGITQPFESTLPGNEAKVTHLMTFELYCDEEYLEKTRETAKKFEGVKLAKIDASKGLVMVTGAVDQERLRLYLKENLKRDVLVNWKKDITSDGNKVSTNTTGVNYGQVKGDDADVVQWDQKLKDDAVRCDGDIYKHRGADGVNKKGKEVVDAVGNINGAWRKDELGGACTVINTPYQQNCGVNFQFQWISPSYQYVSPFSDEVVSRDGFW